MVKATLSNFKVDLSGHTALVTGAGAFIGRAVARALAAAGAKVIVSDFNPDRVERVAEEITSAGGQAFSWQADVSNRFQVGSLIESARDAYGRINLLINAAGAVNTTPMLNLDEWDWRRLLDMNLTGAFFCSQLLGRVMAEEGGGVIVNITPSVRKSEGGVSYVAAKAGVIGLTQRCALEYAPHGIRVNVVCPGSIADTNQIGTPDDVANVVLFLCSDAANFINGQAIHVDGGEGDN